MVTNEQENPVLLVALKFIVTVWHFRKVFGVGYYKMRFGLESKNDKSTTHWEMTWGFVKGFGFAF